MKTYTTALTGWAGAVIAFDVIWKCTKMEVIEAFYVSAIIGFFTAFGFMLLTDLIQGKRSGKSERPNYVQDEDTGIQYMPMRNGRAI